MTQFVQVYMGRVDESRQERGVHGPSGREPTRASEESEEEDNAHVC